MDDIVQTMSVAELPVLSLEMPEPVTQGITSEYKHVSKLTVNIIKLESVYQHHDIELNKSNWHGTGQVISIDDVDYLRQDADYESDHTRSEESSDISSDAVVDATSDVNAENVVDVKSESTQDVEIETGVEICDVHTSGNVGLNGYVSADVDVDVPTIVVVERVDAETQTEEEEKEEVEESEDEEEDGEEEDEIDIDMADEGEAVVVGDILEMVEVEEVCSAPPVPEDPPTPAAPLPPMWVRTVVFIKKVTVPGQDLFIRGGLSAPHITADDKNNNIRKDGSIAIEYQSLGTTPHYDKYNSWREGVTKLDWYGRDEGQGYFEGMPAVGAPGAWTSNLTDVVEYQPLNVYGPHYWMLDFLTDYTQTNKGWFEFRSFLTNGDGWEFDIHQDSACAGTEGGTTPFSSTNHVAKCGFINVFEFNSSSCRIEEFPV